MFKHYKSSNRLLYIYIYIHKELASATNIYPSFQTAEQLGFRNYIPPYATASGRALLGGVNYASAAAGIRDETGQQLVIINHLLILYIINIHFIA